MGLADESCPSHVYLVLQTSPARIKVFKAPARKHRGNQQHSETISVLRLHDIGNGLYQATPPVQKPSAIQLDTSLFAVSCVMTRISCVRCYLYQFWTALGLRRCVRHRLSRCAEPIRARGPNRDPTRRLLIARTMVTRGRPCEKYLTIHAFAGGL